MTDSYKGANSQQESKGAHLPFRIGRLSLIYLMCFLCLFAAGLLLETKLAGELDASRVVGDAVIDAPEDRRSDDGGRVVKRRVVQHVAGIHSQIETHALGDFKFLRER